MHETVSLDTLLSIQNVGLRWSEAGMGIASVVESPAGAQRVQGDHASRMEDANTARLRPAGRKKNQLFPASLLTTLLLSLFLKSLQLIFNTNNSVLRKRTFLLWCCKRLPLKVDICSIFSLTDRTELSLMNCAWFLMEIHPSLNQQTHLYAK